MTIFNPMLFKADKTPNLWGTYSGISHNGEDVGSCWNRVFGLATWKKVPDSEGVWFLRAKELPIVLTCIRLSDGRLDVAYYPYTFPEFKKLWEDKEVGRQELYSNVSYVQVEEDGYPFIGIYEHLKARQAL